MHFRAVPSDDKGSHSFSIGSRSGQGWPEVGTARSGLILRRVSSSVCP